MHLIGRIGIMPSGTPPGPTYILNMPLLLNFTDTISSTSGTTSRTGSGMNPTGGILVQDTENQPVFNDGLIYVPQITNYSIGETLSSSQYWNYIDVSIGSGIISSPLSGVNSDSIQAINGFGGFGLHLLFGKYSGSRIPAVENDNFLVMAATKNGIYNGALGFNFSNSGVPVSLPVAVVNNGVITLETDLLSAGGTFNFSGIISLSNGWSIIYISGTAPAGIDGMEPTIAIFDGNNPSVNGTGTNDFYVFGLLTLKTDYPLPILIRDVILPKVNFGDYSDHTLITDLNWVYGPGWEIMSSTLINPNVPNIDPGEEIVNYDFSTWTDPQCPDGWALEFTPDLNNYVEQSVSGHLHIVSNGDTRVILSKGLNTLFNYLYHQIIFTLEPGGGGVIDLISIGRDFSGGYPYINRDISANFTIASIGIGQGVLNDALFLRAGEVLDLVVESISSKPVTDIENCLACVTTQDYTDSFEIECAVGGQGVGGLFMMVDDPTNPQYGVFAITNRGGGFIIALVAGAYALIDSIFIGDYDPKTINFAITQLPSGGGLQVRAIFSPTHWVTANIDDSIYTFGNNGYYGVTTITCSSNEMSFYNCDFPLPDFNRSEDINTFVRTASLDNALSDEGTCVAQIIPWFDSSDQSIWDEAAATPPGTVIDLVNLTSTIGGGMSLYFPAGGSSTDIVLIYLDLGTFTAASVSCEFTRFETFWIGIQWRNNGTEVRMCRRFNGEDWVYGAWTATTGFDLSNPNMIIGGSGGASKRPFKTKNLKATDSVFDVATMNSQFGF